MTPEQQATAKLDKVTIDQLVWKPSPVLTVAIRVTQAAIFAEGLPIWPDDIDTSDIGDDDKNCIGIAFRLLAKQDIVERQNNNTRKSKAGPRKGSYIAAYRLKNLALAKEFLRRNKVVPPDPQMKMDL